ncbi:DUF6461 domain-containing protein [Streptomyces sp. NBC_00464]|uniref:DUF6461 domain-containing protein n=1 Tax=Streptomyces sp. NBC_00464 TaxID=2975751 RepID=UPI002E1890E2
MWMLGGESEEAEHDESAPVVDGKAAVLALPEKFAGIRVTESLLQDATYELGLCPRTACRGVDRHETSRLMRTALNRTHFSTDRACRDLAIKALRSGGLRAITCWGFRKCPKDAFEVLRRCLTEFLISLSNHIHRFIKVLTVRTSLLN